MELDKDFREFIELLNEHDVAYLVIGGYAVNFHGYPRYTKDIDLWLWLTQENIEKLIQAIKGFGILLLGKTGCEPGTPRSLANIDAYMGLGPQETNPTP